MYNLFLKDSKIFLLFRILTAVGWLISLYFLTSIFDPESYGIFFLINTLILLTTNISSTWISASILRFFPETESKETKSFTTQALILSLISSFFISLLIFLLYKFFNQRLPIQERVIIVGIAWFILNSLIVSSLTFLRSKRDITKYSILNFIHQVVSLLIGIILIIIVEQDIFYLILGICTGNALTLLIIYHTKIKSNLTRVFTISNVKATFEVFFSFGVWATIINLFSIGLSHFDKFLIFQLLGEKKNGIYSALYQLSEQSIFSIISIFAFVSTPIIYKSWNNNRAEVPFYLNQVLNLYVILVIPLLSISCIFYSEIGIYILGENYSSHFYLIPIITTAASFVGVTTIFTDVLTAEKKIISLAKCYFYAFLTNISLNLLLTNKLGLIGPAIVSAISYVLLLFIVLKESNKVINIRIGVSNILKTLGIGVFLTVFFIQTTKHFFYKSPLGVYETMLGSFIYLTLYISLLIKLKIIKSEMVNNLRND